LGGGGGEIQLAIFGSQVSKFCTFSVLDHIRGAAQSRRSP
jgi:hypothetical protein